MSQPRLVQIDSVATLRAAASAWDDLWRRSDVSMPTCRAELLAQWVEQFSPRAEFRALAVEDQGQWAAALPLVGCKVGRVIAAGGMPSNPWVSSGELLLDPAADLERVLDLLVAAMRRLPWSLLWLDEAVLDASRWTALQQALSRAAIPSLIHQRYQVAWLPIEHDWETYRQTWSGKHRQKMARCWRRLEETGDVHLVTLTEFAPAEVETWVRRGFEIEDRSWKGPTGSSVLRVPSMFGCFVRQAQQLAQWGQLELSFLQCGQQPIAFAYGSSAKGVYHSCKIGYDPDYAAFSPGQLLRYCMLRQFHSNPERKALDCQGPLTDAHLKWRPAYYTIGRLAVAPGCVGRALLGAYRYGWPYARRLRGVKSESDRLDRRGSRPLAPTP